MVCWAIHPISGSYICFSISGFYFWTSWNIIEHPPRYSWNIIEHPPRYSWNIIEHPPRYSWIIIELASSLRRWLRRGENYPKIKGFPRSKRHYVTYVKDLGMWFVYFKQFPTIWNSRRVSIQIQRWIKQESQWRFHDFRKGRYLHYIIKAR